MESCSNCIHHDACKMWVDHNNSIIDRFDAFNKMVLGDKAKKISKIKFPMTKDPKFDILCANYAPKENETVQP